MKETLSLPRYINCLCWVCYGSAQAILFSWYASIKCLTIVQAICGEFPRFLRLFFYNLVAGIYVTKTVKKCLQFVYIFADLLPVKCQTKFLILAVKCLTNCLLQQSIFFLNCLLNACTIVWKNMPFLPINCLTRIQTLFFCLIFVQSRICFHSSQEVLSPPPSPPESQLVSLL
jgi:hypothetical protein